MRQMTGLEAYRRGWAVEKIQKGWIVINLHAINDPSFFMSIEKKIFPTRRDALDEIERIEKITDTLNKEP